MRQFRGLIVITVLVALAIVALAIPTIKIFGFSRGNDQNILGLTLGLDLQGGTHLVYQMVPRDGQSVTQDDADAIRTIIEKRVNAYGVSEATVQLLGGGGTSAPDRLLVQIPGQGTPTLTIAFRGGTVTSQQVADFFHNKLNKPDAKVTDNTDGSMTIHFDSLSPEQLDNQGNVIKPAEVTTFKNPLELEFPATLSIAFAAPQATATPTPDASATPSPTPEATATPTPDTGSSSTGTPTLDEVYAAFQAAGRSDAQISDDGNGLFTVTIAGLQERTTDAQGNVDVGDLARIQEQLQKIGTLAFLSTSGDLTQYVAGGGVQEAKQLIGETAHLEFRERDCGSLTAPSPDVAWPPDGLTQDQWLAVRCDDPKYYTEKATDIDPADLTDAYAGTQQGVTNPVVNLVFNDKGAQAFFDVTDRISRNGGRLAIYLDGQELVAPSAQQGISGGRAFIQSPTFTAERARTIAIQLKSGALPLDLKLVQERNVDATLGAESLKQSLVAGGIGLILLLFFMVTYYKVPGVVASVALVFYLVLLLAIFKVFPVTLTLSGVAAVILSLGMAVDANILISERTKEELRTGRGLMVAINAGFDRAWPSIRDGNLSTIITAVVLFWFGDRFGTSIMQGFALTLIIGVLLSMGTAFLASRVLLRFVARTPLARKNTWFVPVVDNVREEPTAGG